MSRRGSIAVAFVVMLVTAGITAFFAYRDGAVAAARVNSSLNTLVIFALLALVLRTPRSRD